VVSGIVVLAGAMTAGPVCAQDTQIDKITLRYVDARYVAAILGARVLPTEGDLWMGRMGGGFGNGMVGGGIGGGYSGGYGGGNGIWADPSTNSLLMLQGSRYGYGGYGNGVYGDPQGNALLVGPRGQRGRSSSRQGSRVYGDPSSNSLLRRR